MEAFKNYNVGWKESYKITVQAKSKKEAWDVAMIKSLKRKEYELAQGLVSRIICDEEIKEVK